MVADDVQPKLPPEIEELIFSIALQSDLMECVNLTLVAKRVYEWLRPHLYKFAILHDQVSRGRPRIDIMLLKAQGQYVRHFLCWLPYLPESQENLRGLATYLSLCPNLVNLALWHSDIVYDERMVDTLLALTLIHLSFDIALFHSHLKKYFISKRVSFTTVTHLSLIGRNITLKMDKITEYFPSVTHMSLNETRVRGLSAQSILDGLRNQLQILVWLMNENETFDGHTVPNDVRVVVMEQSTAFVWDWEKAAEDGPESMWTVAEREVKRRREMPDIDWRRVIKIRGD